MALPTYDPETVSKQAMAEYDKNNDGKLDSAELEKCPALYKSLAQLDRNGDSALDAEEIAERMREYQRSNIGVTSSLPRFVRNGRPLSGATVTLVPEPFMAGSISLAKGVTSEDGRLRAQAEDVAIPGVRCGFYRVQVSLKDASGQETLPAKYNSATTLGQEFAPVQRGTILFELD